MTFEELLKKTLKLEGGLKVHKNPTEPAITYAGIYRKAHPEWEGWKYIDRGETPPFELIKNFYYENFYKPLEPIESSAIRAAIFDMAVNAGLRTAIKLAQRVVGVTPDGIVGPKTAQALNSYGEDNFLRDYTLSRIAFYTELANREPKRYALYLRGWVNRALEVLKWAS